MVVSNLVYCIDGVGRSKDAAINGCAVIENAARRVSVVLTKEMCLEWRESKEPLR